MGRGARLRHTGSPMADSTLVMPARVRDQTCRGTNVRRRHFTLGAPDPGHQDQNLPRRGDLIAGRVPVPPQTCNAVSTPGQTPENLDSKLPRSLHKQLCPRYVGME